MNRPWRDCAARNIRISASAKYFRKKRRARRLPVSNRQIPTRRKSCAADKVSLWRNRPAGVERLHSTPQTSNVRRPGFAGRRTFLRSKTRRANLYAPSPQAPPLRIWLHKARPPPYAKRLDAPRIFAWARVCVCTNDASAPLANRRECAGFAARTMCRQGTPPSCASHDACAGTHLFMGLPASISPSIGACASMLCLQAF